LTPSKMVMVKEERSRFLKTQRAYSKFTPRSRRQMTHDYLERILELRQEGATFKEIAAELNVSERTARRIMKRFSEKYFE